MPRTWDRKHPSNDKDPTANRLDYDNPGGVIDEGAEKAGDPINQFFSSVGKLFNLPTPQDVISGVANGVEAIWNGVAYVAKLIGGLLDPFQIPTIDPTKILNLPGLFDTARRTVNAIVAGLTGLFGQDWDPDDAQAAAEALAQQQADTAASVAKLQQLNSGNAQGGNSTFVDFTSMPDASTMGTSFLQIYSGAGSDTLGVVGGRVTVTPGTWDAGRECVFAFTDKVTLTDLQRVSIVLGTSPGKRTFGPFGNLHSYAYNYIRARIAETGPYAGIDCVMVIFDIDSFDLGFVKNGVWTKWITVNHKYRPGAIYSLDAGSAGGARQYKVLLNDGSIYTHNEVGTLSNMGVGYRGTGGGAEWVIGSDGAGGRFNTLPGALAAFYMADNTPPAALSSIGRAFRASSVVVNFNTASTEYTLPASFFDTFDYSTPDLVWNGTAGTWTVNRRGNYLVNVNFGNNNTSLSGVPVLYVNGIRTVVGNSGVYSTVSFAMPLEPGDVLSLTYFTITANCRIYGSTAGEWTFFQVLRVSPDTLEDITT